MTRQPVIVLSAMLFTLAFAAIEFAVAEEEVVVHRNIAYVDSGDARHEADIYVPPGEGPFPGVLMIHGGAWMTGSKGHMLGHARTVVDAGYTVMSINYRLAPKHKFPAQVDDCKAAVRFMRDNAQKYKIDGKKIATYGYSAGGHLACLLGMTDAEDGLEGSDLADEATDTRVQCVIAGGAPCEFRTMPKRVSALGYWLGGTREKVPENYRLASPTTFATADDPPVFFFHGEKDTLVPEISPKALMTALEAHDIKCQFHVVSGKGHIGAFLDRNSPKEAVKFLDAKLKARSE